MVCSFLRNIHLTIYLCFSRSSFGPPSKRNRTVHINEHDQGGEDSLLKKQLKDDIDF